MGHLGTFYLTFTMLGLTTLINYTVIKKSSLILDELRFVSLFRDLPVFDSRHACPQQTVSSSGSSQRNVDRDALKRRQQK